MTKDYTEYKKYWRKIRSERESQRKEKRRELLSAAERCARLLVEKYNAETVFVHGSVLDARRFKLNSDLDLAVEGLRPQLYFTALSDLYKIIPEDCELDLVPLEDATEEMKREIRNRGSKLADAGEFYSPEE